VTRVAVFRDSSIAAGPGMFGAIQALAPSLGVELRPVDVRSRNLLRLKKNLAGESQSAALCWPSCGGLGCPPTENARQFSVSCVLTGSAAAREITVVPIKSAFLALCSVP